MKRHLSPATVLAGLALFISLGGTSVAAISYATRAGAVDGKSAVGASSSLSHAAGKLVATYPSGSDKGQIPSRFVAGIGHASAYGSAVQVADNATGAPTGLGGDKSVGSLSATCTDENPAAGVADPSTTLAFTNSAGAAVNFSSRIGGQNATVAAQQPSTVQSVVVRGSNSFVIEAQYLDRDLRFEGAVRQDGRNTADAKCLVYGTVTLVS